VQPDLHPQHLPVALLAILVLSLTRAMPLKVQKLVSRPDRLAVTKPRPLYGLYVEIASINFRMGELEPWVDESYIKNLWYTMGEQVNVKMIRDKFSGYVLPLAIPLMYAVTMRDIVSSISCRLKQLRRP
jgi:hypothetical protein